MTPEEIAYGQRMLQEEANGIGGWAAVDTWVGIVHAWAVGCGWWDPPKESRRRRTWRVLWRRSAPTYVHNIPEKLALIHSEVSEALEAYRDGQIVTAHRDEDGKPEGYWTELADVVIRIMDLYGREGRSLRDDISEKMLFNATRPYRHGGKAC